MKIRIVQILKWVGKVTGKTIVTIVLFSGETFCKVLLAQGIGIAMEELPIGFVFDEAAENIFYSLAIPVERLIPYTDATIQIAVDQIGGKPGIGVRKIFTVGDPFSPFLVIKLMALFTV